MGRLTMRELEAIAESFGVVAGDGDGEELADVSVEPPVPEALKGL